MVRQVLSLRGDVMGNQRAGGATLRTSTWWPAAAIVALALALVPTPAAHAGTHLAVHVSTRLAGPGNGNTDNKGKNGSGPATATPEPGSGELVVLGLLTGMGVVLTRRTRGHAKARRSAAGR